MKTEILSGEKKNLAIAGKLLKNSELVAFPTETVYGLGARISDEKAIRKVFQIKGRPPDNPLIVHISKLDSIAKVAEEIPADFFRLQERFFPGPLTVILKKHKGLSFLITGGRDSVAIRMPHHPVAEKLISLVGEPLAAPSANLSGRPSPTLASHVFEDFNQYIPLILDGGPCRWGLESTVVSLLSETPHLLRPGVITSEEIEEVLQKKVQRSSEQLAPGMKYRHYAPKAAIYTFDTLDTLLSHLQTPMERLILGKDLPVSHHTLNSRDLYYHFRMADAKGYKEICIFLDPQIKKQEALMNRIFKASYDPCYKTSFSLL